MSDLPRHRMCSLNLKKQDRINAEFMHQLEHVKFAVNMSCWQGEKKIPFFLENYDPLQLWMHFLEKWQQNFEGGWGVDFLI